MLYRVYPDSSVMYRHLETVEAMLLRHGIRQCFISDSVTHLLVEEDLRVVLEALGHDFITVSSKPSRTELSWKKGAMMLFLVDGPHGVYVRHAGIFTRRLNLPQELGKLLQREAVPLYDPEFNHMAPAMRRYLKPECGWPDVVNALPDWEEGFGTGHLLAHRDMGDNVQFYIEAGACADGIYVESRIIDLNEDQVKAES